MHAFAWFKRASAYFQLHGKDSFKRDVAKRNVYGHYEWLKKKHGFPIYMQFVYNEIPDSVEYPLAKIVDKFFGKGITKGGKTFKYFTSTFAFEIALALYQGYERIEIYGFDMSGQDEFGSQKPCAEFWLGVARGMGVEIYLPPNNQLLWGPLYGYEGNTSMKVGYDFD
jgi:hypothetical protein